MPANIPLSPMSGRATVLVANGIECDCADQFHWTRELVTDLTVNHGLYGDTFQYSVHAVDAFVHADEYARLVARKIGQRQGSMRVSYIGHSFGCEIISRVLRQFDWAHLETVHLFAGAVDSNFDANGFNEALRDGRVGQLYCYGSPDDLVLRDLARPSEMLLGWLGIGFGDLGLVGPRNVDPVVADRVHLDYRPGIGHGWWMDGEQFYVTSAEIARTIAP